MENIKRVLISDEIADVCVNKLSQNGIEVVKNTKLTREQLLEEIKNYDGLIVRSATRVDAAVIESGDRLKVIGRAGVGVDNIDCDAATRKGVLVLNTPLGNTLSAAEHTCAMMCSLARHIPQACAALKGGKWDRKSYMGTELNGKTLGIVGLGRIGKEVALRMQAFGMRTIGFDPITPVEVAASWGVQSMSLEEMWPQCDYITVHTPLIPQTKNLISKATFAKCKKGVRIINCARGGIIEENDLLEALNNGQCGGAGLDVFLEEPPTNTELISHKLVIGTPHLGASTEEAQTRVAEEAAEAFVALRDGKALMGAVNGHALAGALSNEGKALTQLITRLGGLFASGNGDAKTIELCMSVPGIDRVPSYAQAAACAGILGDGGNLINAVSTAQAKSYNVNATVNTMAPNGDIILYSGDNSVTGALCGDDAVLIAWNGDSLNTPLKFAAQRQHFYAFKSSDASDVWKSLTGSTSDIVGVSFGSKYMCVVSRNELKDATNSICHSAF